MDKNATAEADETPPPPEDSDHRIRWSGLSLIFDEKTLNALVGRLVDRIPDLQDLRVAVTPGELAATLVVHRFGVPLSAKATLSQLRMKDGFLAFVLDKVQALSFIPIPDQLLHYLVAKAPPGLLTYYPEDHIMVVNLNDWMPPGIDLSLERTLFEPGQLTLQFASGSYDLADFLRSPAGEDD
ncbi:MAG TPA: hypothetical protein VOA00_13010 [Thermoanaerobaculia bacterium]|nr:hypothetical protein [Thermoanaerobaculia bacterium]